MLHDRKTRHAKASLSIMRLKTAVIATACAAAEMAAHSMDNGATCSSLNGPFCTYFGFGTALAPLHARQNLAADEKVMETTEMLFEGVRSVH